MALPSGQPDEEFVSIKAEVNLEVDGSERRGNSDYRVGEQMTKQMEETISPLFPAVFVRAGYISSSP